ncbi:MULTISPECIES: PLxRFG domain-containing protein [unclassified Desulfovibrio]|uniref:PLxRFG domain-containing protein n=1 Tax=unclassified Desulfovibrio TaxID=2593640 RepID=UPI0013EDB2AC|nr:MULTISPECIES: PLxRFG domain-containing protein [unclassified Desulfovibrio]
MPKQTANRPTNTDYSSLLLDFTGVDFTGGNAPQEAQQEEPGFLSKLANSGEAILEGITMIPDGIVDTVRDAWGGGDIDVTDKAELERRAQREREKEAYVRKYQGKTFEGIPDAMTSLPYSMGTMGASLGAGLAAGVVGGPVAGAAAGMAASGVLAYRATKEDFMRRMLGETEKALGRAPTQEEWDRIAADFDSEATQYGLWEAGPEALSNLFMAKLLGPLGSKIFKGGIGHAAKRVAGLYGEELATETATQMGQGDIEAGIGQRDKAPGAWEAFKEVAPATFWQTTLMAGGKKAADLVSNRMRRRSDDAANNTINEDEQAPDAEGENPQKGSAFMDAGSVQPAAPYVFEQQPGNMPVPRSAAPRDFVRDYQDEMSYAETDNFIREQEEREQAQADADFLIEQGRAPSVRYTPHQQALEAGETIDLLQLPQDATGMAQGISVFGLPEGTGAQAMGTNDTGLGTIAPPTDFYEPRPITTPYQPKQALPQEPGASSGPGRWAGGRSQLSYPWPGMAQGIGGLMGVQQPEQVTPPPAMPTQSQITNTQVAPRADTTAMAEGLGMPAPEAMPQEAKAPEAAPAITGAPRTPQVEPSWGYALPSFVTAPYAKGGASPRTSRRTELLNSLSEEKRRGARRMTNAELERYVETEQNPVPLTEENLSRDPAYNLPTAPAGTVFALPDGKKTKPFPKTDFSTPEKASASKKRVEQWAFNNVVAQGAKINESEGNAGQMQPEQAASETQNSEQENAERKYWGTIQNKFGEYKVHTENGHVVIGKRRISLAEAIDDMQKAIDRYGQDGATRRFKAIEDAINFLKHEEEGRNREPQSTERTSYGTIPTETGQAHVYAENGHVVVGDSRMTPAEAKGIVQSALEKHGPDVARQFEPLKKAAQAIEESEKRDSNPKDLFANVVNTDRVKSLTDSEVEMINAMFDKKKEEETSDREGSQKESSAAALPELVDGSIEHKAGDGEVEKDPFGPSFPEYSGRPKEAIEHLLKVREGYVPAAFHKEGLGDIDLPWGNSKFGLQHIIERRNKDGLDGVAFAKRLPEIINNGRVENDAEDSSRKLIISDRNKAVISLEWQEKKRTWLVTAYPLHNQLENSGQEVDFDQTLANGKTPPSDSQAENAIGSQPAFVNSNPSTAESPRPAKRNYGTADNPNTVALAEYFADKLSAGTAYSSIVQARKEAGELMGGHIAPGTIGAKAIDEAIELGAVKAARKTVEDMRARGASDVEIFRALVDLYQRQPTLGTRTSTSVAQQAYSTPTPIAFLASRLAHIGKDTTVYEPTAGNGALLIEATPGNVTANELNPKRARRLRAQGFTVTEQDAVEFKPPYGVDVVIANPPFGRVWNENHTATQEMVVDGFATKELDQAIVVRALKALKGQRGAMLSGKGRAVLIIGGKQGGTEARKKGYRSASQTKFWGWLFNNYHVLEHFSIDGKLYSRQGASFPIDVIVLDTNGTSEGRIFPGAQPPRMFTSFESLEELFNGRTLDNAGHRARGDVGSAAELEGERGQEPQRAEADSGLEHQEAPSGRGGRGGDAGGEPGGAVRHGARGAQGASQLQSGDGNLGKLPGRGGRGGDRQHADGHYADGQAAEPVGHRVPPQDNDGGSGRVPGKPGMVGNGRDGERLSGKKPEKRPQRATKFQTPYQKTSAHESLGTLVPKNMATSIRKSMAELEKAHGNIDDYVAGELGYPASELGQYFAAEQIDAIGLAIHNLSQGAGFIIGDQTGVGKGRVNAAIIRWAKRQGLIPVFVTRQTTLYGDMVRDLSDIGMEGFTPLPTNNGLTGKDAIPLPDGRTLRTASSAKHEKILREALENGLDGYDAVFTTYDQMKGTGNKPTPRRDFLSQLAPRALFILDESHSAGGSASGDSWEVKGKAAPVSKFVRELLQKSPNGVFYSSATYAKSPKVMDLYMKTDMRHAVNDISALAEAISRGGIPMQQVVASQLAEAGQYIRRERTWEGADVETQSVKTDARRADDCADALHAIMLFDRAKQKAVEEANDAAAASGGLAFDNQGANEDAMKSTSFATVMHNLIAQAMLAQKVDAIVNGADEALKRGEKPVITLSNTMESAIKEYAQENGLGTGDAIGLSFKDLFLRYLQKARQVTIKDSDGNTVETRPLTDGELGPGAVRRFKEAEAIINRSNLEELPVSFIDSIAQGLRERGYTVGEITGRTAGIDYSGETPVLATRKDSNSLRAKVIDGFNNGGVDALILNSSGSTGISLHASERFKDQRRRTMIIAQPDLNIDTFMQTLGRIFRTGQVVPPKYQLLFTDIPAEKRPAAILAKKMASLNANTTAAKDSDASFQNIPDFMNEYGDRVAKAVIAENEELHEKMGKPLEKLKEDEDSAMRKLTGYIPLLPVKEQARLYELLETQYNELIAQEEALGTLDLEAKALPLDAILEREEEIAPKKDVGPANSPFTAAAKLGTYSVKRLGRPFPAAKVREMVAAGKSVDVEEQERRFETWLAKRLKGLSPESREGFEERSRETLHAFLREANFFRPGTPVTISNGRDGSKVLGIVTSVYQKGTPDNPLALSTWKVEFAVADASKKLMAPFSQIENEDASGLIFRVLHESEADAVYAALDSGQSDSREKVHIATGNIIAAYERLGKGKVVQFEDHEGNIIPGIMLPKDTNINDLLNNIDVPLTPAQAMDFLSRVEERFGAVKTEDKNFVLTRTVGDSYTIAVPASKAKGAAYYLNGGILKAAGKDFAKVGNSMCLKFLPEQKARAILEVMSSQGFGLVADNNKDVAREITGQKKVDVRPLASISPAEFLRHHLPSDGMQADTVRRVVAKLGENAKNAAESRVVQTFDELPENIRQRYADEETTLEGVFDPATGVVWFVADNLSDAERVAEVWAHEQIVHHGLRGMLTEAERKSILNRLWFSMGGMGNARIRQIARTYGLDPRNNVADRLTVMEEVVASLAEKKRLDGLTPQEMTFWKRIVRAVAQAWERLVRAVAGGDYTVAHKADVDGLLTTLGRYVMEGIPATGSMRDAATAMASVRQGSEEVSYQQLGRRESPHDLVLLPDGSPDFGMMDAHRLNNGTTLKAAPFRLKRGRSYMGAGFGLAHIEDVHGDDIREAGYPGVQAFVWDMVNGFDEIWEGSGKSMTLVRHGSKGKQAGFVELEKNGEFYEIKSAFPVDTGYPEGGTKKLLWKRHSLASTATDERNPFLSEFNARLGHASIKSEDAPKSLRGQSSGEKINHSPENGNTPLASLSLKRILGMSVKDAAKASDVPEIQHLFRKSDLTFMQSIVQLPHWIAKQAKEFAAIYDRQLQRMDERSAALKKSLETVPSLFGKSRLAGPDLESLKKLLWKIEGREMWQEHVSQVDKVVTKEVLPNGRELIEINPKFYEVFKKALDAENATPRAKEAMLEIRKSLDNDLVRAHNRMAHMAGLSDGDIRKFRQSIGHVPNYFPHHRYGAYFVQATVAVNTVGEDGKKKVGYEVVYRQHFDAISEKAAMAKAKQIVMEQRANYPDAKWTDGKNENLPDEVLGAPFDYAVMEQVIRVATSKIGDKERAQEISKILSEGVSDVLKARGWGSHGIRRKGVPGFETEDIARVLYDYKAGLNGWLTKMEAAWDFSDALSNIDARKKPNLWKYASQYTKDMLRNSDRVDRITGNIKAVAFAWYLGGSIKTAVVNATQNLVVGVPRLQMDVTGGGLMWLKGAQDALVDRVTGNKGRGLSDDEARLIEELYGESVITDAFMEEVRGQLRGVTGASLWNKFTKILGLPMSEIERFNRASLALAAYRAARSGKLKEKAKGKYGIEGKATYEQAKEFASEVVRDAHFVYGKSNMPEFMRSNTAGRAMASMYTFRTFSHNMLAMWAWALRTQGREGATFCAKSIGATMALGGVTALPLYATLMALFQAVTGDDDDWTETIRNYLPQNNLLRDAVCYGAPAIAGVSIGGSLKMETPLTKGLSKGKNPKEVLTDSIGDIIGIPYDLGIVKVSNMMDAQAQGNYWRMIEEAMPTFIRNGMQAWRLYSEGQTTMRGRPINSPGKEGARKLSGAEAVGKALGFQPVSSTKSYDAYAASKRRDEVRSAKLDELTVMALKTHDTGDPSGRRQAIKEIEAWNAKMREEGKPQMTITLQDVMRRVKARRRQNRVNDKQREKGARQAEVWGV